MVPEQKIQEKEVLLLTSCESLHQAQTRKIFTCKGKTTKPREEEAEGLTNEVSSSCCKFAEPVTFLKSAAST